MASRRKRGEEDSCKSHAAGRSNIVHNGAAPPPFLQTQGNLGKPSLQQFSDTFSNAGRFPKKRAPVLLLAIKNIFSGKSGYRGGETSRCY